MIFHKLSKIAIIGITICLIILGFFSCAQVQLGLNQNVSLVEGSDTYDYFESLYVYGDAGPPAYLIFKNVNYTDSANLD